MLKSARTMKKTIISVLLATLSAGAITILYNGSPKSLSLKDLTKKVRIAPKEDKTENHDALFI